MLAFPGGIRIYVAVQPVDMRKQYDGLWAAAQEQLNEDPKNGAVFCFINKERTRLKLLYWDGTGVWVLALLVGGIELKDGCRKAWYER
jgi:transposase